MIKEKYLRVDCNGTIELEIYPGKFHTGRIKNVSLVGLTIALSEIIEEGDYDFNFVIEEKEFNNVEGRIKFLYTNKEEQLYRVEFIKLTSTDKKWLGKIIKDLYAKQRLVLGKETSFIERRQCLRYNVDNGIIELQIDLEKTYPGIVKNISIKGINIALKEKVVEIEKNYKFNFVVNKIKFKNITGEVKWWLKNGNEYLFGIEFIKLSFFNKLKLMYSLKKLSSIKHTN